MARAFNDASKASSASTGRAARSIPARRASASRRMRSAAAAPCLRATWLSGTAWRKARWIAVVDHVGSSPGAGLGQGREPDRRHVREVRHVGAGDPVPVGGLRHRIVQGGGRRVGDVVVLGLAEAARIGEADGREDGVRIRGV